MSIHAVLLAPAEGDPHGLLGDPESVAWKCGARPPVVRWCEVGPNEWAWLPEDDAHCERDADLVEGERRALGLGWEGEVVREGCWRVEAQGPTTMGADCAGIPRALHRAYIVGCWAVGRGLGSLVLLDEQGRGAVP